MRRELVLQQYTRNMSNVISILLNSITDFAMRCRRSCVQHDVQSTVTLWRYVACHTDTTFKVSEHVANNNLACNNVSHLIVEAT